MSMVATNATEGPSLFPVMKTMMLDLGSQGSMFTLCRPGVAMDVVTKIMFARVWAPIIPMFVLSPSFVQMQMWDYKRTCYC